MMFVSLHVVRELNVLPSIILLYVVVHYKQEETP